MLKERKPNINTGILDAVQTCILNPKKAMIL